MPRRGVNQATALRTDLAVPHLEMDTEKNMAMGLTVDVVHVIQRKIVKCSTSHQTNLDLFELLCSEFTDTSHG